MDNSPDEEQARKKILEDKLTIGGIKTGFLSHALRSLAALELGTSAYAIIHFEYRHFIVAHPEYMNKSFKLMLAYIFTYAFFDFCQIFINFTNNFIAVLIDTGKSQLPADDKRRAYVPFQIKYLGACCFIIKIPFFIIGTYWYIKWYRG